MPKLRFTIGTTVMCNFGPSGWKLGRIIAIDYREHNWAIGQTAPYQVILEEDSTLIYVPEDDDRCCRLATVEDMRISRQLDALAPHYEESQLTEPHLIDLPENAMNCGSDSPRSIHDYRKGLCHCCSPCPHRWSSAELYSQHYRAAERNGLKVTHHAIDLGRFKVGESLKLNSTKSYPVQAGFMQCPTLVRLPPGLRFSDDGSLKGKISFDPHRDTEYQVEFIAVSTAAWDDHSIGLVRLQISLTVEGNTSPAKFDMHGFLQKAEEARTKAKTLLQEVWHTWECWENGELHNRETCDRICSFLHQLRTLLEEHPRLDDGKWWAQLGGFHMNVHKLLENTLFECEVYLGHALTFGNHEVRQMAERNLEGCYQKRLLEAARFMWMEGLKQMMEGNWTDAIKTLDAAASKKDGWGWAVNYGDIWISNSAARLIYGTELLNEGSTLTDDGRTWIAEALELLEKGALRAKESGAFGPDGHPWAIEIADAFISYRDLIRRDADTSDWIDNFKARTLYWCGQVLAGAPPFPPKPRPRRDDAQALLARLRASELTTI